MGLGVLFMILLPKLNLFELKNIGHFFCQIIFDFGLLKILAPALELLE
jgi:hypothetical protein